VVKIVDESAAQLFQGVPGSPLQIVDQTKRWEGSVMHFAFTGKMGFFTAPLRGSVSVTDKDVTIECELPALLKGLVPMQRIEEGIKTRIRGLLA
jgi:hypothetical protein